MKIMISTGGTGGHIFPAIALAERLIKENNEVYYAIDNRFKKIYSYDPKTMYIIESSSILPGLKGKIISLYKIMKGIISSMILLYKLKPDIVIGFGGYPSFPCCFGAYFLGIPVFIHEQNAVLGNANMVLAKFATKILTSFEKTEIDQDKYNHKICYVGNPVRYSVSKYANNTKPKKAEQFVICILGGSLGAKFLSKNLAEILVSLPESHKKNLKIIHQAIEHEIDDIKNIYDNEKITAEVNSFFDDVGYKIYESNIVIARSGATTIAELKLLCKKAIFIPLKSFKDHQYLNAKYMEDNNMGWIISENDVDFKQKLLNQIIDVINNQNQLIVNYDINNQNNSADNIIKQIKLSLNEGKKND
jgi:UDP-N-acetylglucosamine--N-acetylmuramyl-(pentapeptide) pyrophosphoryl-undecaprenol N-acetylglucosamine transferase